MTMIFSSNPYYLWEVAGVVPCRRHTVRLYLGENYIEVLTLNHVCLPGPNLVKKILL